MINWIKKLFEDSNGIPDDARLAAFIVVLTFISNSVIAVVMSSDHHFDAQQFGTGAGLMAAGIGGWFKLRQGN